MREGGREPHQARRVKASAKAHPFMILVYSGADGGRVVDRCFGPTAGRARFSCPESAAEHGTRRELFHARYFFVCARCSFVSSSCLVHGHGDSTPDALEAVMASALCLACLIACRQRMSRKEYMVEGGS